MYRSRRRLLDRSALSSHPKAGDLSTDDDGARPADAVSHETFGPPTARRSRAYVAALDGPEILNRVVYWPTPWGRGDADDEGGNREGGGDSHARCRARTDRADEQRDCPANRLSWSGNVVCRVSSKLRDNPQGS